MPVLLTTKPSDPEDPRFRLPRSPECPNDAPAKVVREGRAGTCGHCAWGFFTLDSPLPGKGESIDGLTLSPVIEYGQQLGYRARCGKVTVFRDERGRIGARRAVDGEERFFPIIEGNWAAERYQANHPALEALA